MDAQTQRNHQSLQDNNYSIMFTENTHTHTHTHPVRVWRVWPELTCFLREILSALLITIQIRAKLIFAVHENVGELSNELEDGA